MVFDAAVRLLGELRQDSDGEKYPEEKYISEECKKNFCSDEAEIREWENAHHPLKKSIILFQIVLADEHP